MADEEHITEGQQKRLDEISASVTDYYDSISEEERAENSDWGDVATASLSQIDWPSDAVVPLTEEAK